MTQRLAVVGALVWLILSGVAGSAHSADSTGQNVASPIHPQLQCLLDGEDAIKVWVFFTDKGVGSPEQRRYALAELAATYSPRAIERRRQRRTAPGLFDDRDLPVHAD